jgi:general secretion pathway protein F
VAEERIFRFKAVGPGGGQVDDVVAAADRRGALRRLQQDGYVVTDIRESDGAVSSQPSVFRRRGVTMQQKIVLLRQLALMVRAGVDLLEALDTIAVGMGGELAAGLKEVSVRLRRGERLRQALAEGLPVFPGYVYALVDLGQSTGRLDQVLESAVRQMEFEDRVRRDVMTALTYPAFLIVAGVAAVGFLFYEVVPRFAAMIGDNARNLDGMAAFVLNTGQGFRANAPLVLIVIAAVAAIIGGFSASARGRAFFAGVAHAAPVLGGLMIARERATWARIMSFALKNGLGLMEATDLAIASVPPGRFQRGLSTANRALRKGKRVDEAFGERGVLARLDLSLLRAGQKSGALAEMFSFIGDQYEDDLRVSLKRFTTLIEPLAIAIVAIAVGSVAIGLVTAMTSVYETVS